MTDFIIVKPKNPDFSEIVLNTKSISYIKPNIIGDSAIVVLYSGEVFNLTESFAELKSKLTAPIPAPIPAELQDLGVISTFPAKDLDEYPADLPRLPTGYVDKRTTAYKNWIAENTK